MPLVCIERPNRSKPRKFSERDAGRIACRVLDEGGNRQRLVKELEKCIGDLCEREKVEQLIKLIEEAAVAIAVSIGILKALLASARAILLLARRIPALRKLAGGLEASVKRLDDAANKAKDITQQAELLSKQIVRR
jgi:hypothetical protein